MPYINEAGNPFKVLMALAGNFKTELGKNKSNISNGVSGGSLQRSSIMRAAKDLVLSFPVLCSDSITPATASMITKAVERNCVTTLQLLFSSAYLQGNDGQEVLRKWHTNMDTDMSMDEYLDLVDAMSATIDSTSVGKKADAFVAKTFGEVAIFEKEMIEECAQNNKRYPLISFSESSILSYTIDTRFSGDTVRKTICEADMDPTIIDPISGQSMSFNQFRAFSSERQRGDSATNFTAQQDNLKSQNMNNNAKYRLDKEKLEFEKNKHADDNNFADKRLDMERDRAARDTFSNNNDFFKKQLMDSDVKKCNELVPSMIIVRFNVTDPDKANTSAVIEKQFIAGVKARLVPCSSFEIIDRVRSIDKNKVSLVNLVRATTKEISFSRDFVAGIEQAKIDAKQNSKLSKTSPIWRSLQNRSTKSVLNRLKKTNRANDAGAITTLVLTQEEVNVLKKDFDIDLTIPAKAKFVMEQYNLMGLVIVDEQIEVARFMFDGEKFFQDYSFNVLERETGDGSYKKVINLISKINRG